MKYYANHPKFGRVTIRIDRRALRIISRWKGGILHITVPPGVNDNDIFRFIDNNYDKLISIRPKTRHYSLDSPIIMDGIRFYFRRQSHAPGKILCTPSLPDTFIEIADDIDLSDDKTTHSISSILLKAAHSLAPEILIPRAEEISAKVGATPTAWRIGRGKKTLGTCDRRGVITLSHELVFLSKELCAYIVCHELAHLLEMNHSPQFHALCDRYCGGKEKELFTALRTYSWPIIL